jgi:O-antigen ligase
VVVGLACVFAVIGLWQEWTGTVFYAQDLRVANTYASFDRVTSVFKDPSIYGRHLVLAIVLLLLAAWLGKVRGLVAAALIALIFAGLYYSYSQSSMAVLFAVALAMALFLGDRRSRIVLAVAAVVFFVGAGTFAGAVAQEHSLRRATSGRSRLVRVTWPVIRDHPLVGVGVGSQPAASHADAKTRLGARKDASHTTPLTVAAELGVVGVLAYLALLAAAGRALSAVVARRRALGLGLAAVFLVLFLHSLFYSGFFEDPIMWGTLGLAAAALAEPAVRRAVEPEPVQELSVDLAPRPQPSRPAEPAPEVLEHP